MAERSAAAEQRSLRTRAIRSMRSRSRRRILQSILNSMSDGVIVADEAGRFILFNPAAETHTALPSGRGADRDVVGALRLLPARYRHAVPGRRVPAGAGDSRARRRRRPTSSSATLAFPKGCGSASTPRR